MKNFRSRPLLLSTIILLTAVLPAAAPTTQADEQPATLAGANAAIDANLSSLNKQSGDLQGQIGEVNGVIAQLTSDIAALEPQIAEKTQLLREAIRQSYVAGDPSSVEVLASNDTFSGVVGQQHYRDEISSKSQSAARELSTVKKQKDDKLADAQKKRDGLLALKGQLDEKISTAQAQEQAKKALAEVTQGKEEEYQKLLAAQRAQEATAVANANSPSPSPRVSAQPVPFSGGRGGNPYPWGQCTWYVYDQTGRGQNGNAGSWRGNSSTPRVGGIMIWRPGQGGASGAGHVGIVIGISGNTVRIRHMNWGGGPGVVTVSDHASTGQFWN